MKRTFTIILLAVLLFTVSLVGVSAKKQKEITVWGFSHTSDCLKQIKSMYEQTNPNVKVNIVEQDFPRTGPPQPLFRSGLYKEDLSGSFKNL